MIDKSSCSALINAVMKYLNFRSSDSKLESVTCMFTEIALRLSNVSKNFIIIVEQRYWKMHPGGCFWWQVYFSNFPEWLLLKDSCKHIFFLEILRVCLHEISLRAKLNIFISVSCQSRSETHRRCYFIAVILTEMKFLFGW